MCLIFQKEKDADLISRAWCENVWSRNNDGWGLAYHRPSNNRLMIKTGMTFDSFWNAFASLQRLPIDVIVHMRMATQGEISHANNHPFLISERHNIWFMHNGCVDYPEEGEVTGDNFVSMEDLENLPAMEAYGGAGFCDYWGYSNSYMEGPSDTYLLAERLFKPMLNNMVNANDFIRSEGFAYIVDKVAGGPSNKFTFHDDRGHILFNRHQWHETSTGIPVSNTYAFSLDSKPSLGYTSNVKKVG